MLKFEDLYLDHDTNSFRLTNKKGDAGFTTDLRLRAFGTRGRVAVSDAEASISFHTTRKRRWLPETRFDGTEADGDMLFDLCEICFSRELALFLDKTTAHDTVDFMISKLDVRDTMMDSFIDSVSCFSFFAAKFAACMGTEEMTIIVEIGVNNVEDDGEDSDDEEYFEEEEEEEHDCVICLEGIKTGVVELPCSHRFHGHCLGKWFERTVSCPLCRSEV